MTMIPLHRLFGYGLLAALLVAGLYRWSDSLAAHAESSPPAKPQWQYRSQEIEIPAATADEPKVTALNQDTVRLALKYLDEGAIAWTRERTCVACHTTGVYMAERTQLSHAFGPPRDEVREKFEKSIPTEVPEPTIRDGVKIYPGVIFAVWRSLGLAQWDRHVTGKLSEATRRSLRDMLLRQTDEGIWPVTSKVEIPYVTTDFELSVQAARAMSAAPGWLEQLEEADLQARVARMKATLRQHRPRHDYERAAQLQLSIAMPDAVSEDDVQAAQKMLRAKQQADGGWSMRRMSANQDWGDKMGKDSLAMLDGEPDAAEPASDAYMTSLAIILLRESGAPASDPQLQRGIDWLKSNQRASGRWWMKSLYKDTYHFSTYISTAHALRALALCGDASIPAASGSR